MDKRRIAILGSTGSIGRQTLDVIREHRDLFEVEMLTCKGSWELMASQAKDLTPTTRSSATRPSTRTLRTRWTALTRRCSRE